MNEFTYFAPKYPSSAQVGKLIFKKALTLHFLESLIINQQVSILNDMGHWVSKAGLRWNARKHV